MITTQTFIQSLSSTLFWDVDTLETDAEKHQQFIVERVLSRGTLEDFKKTVSYYGKKKLSEIVVKIKYLDPKTLQFCSIYFSIEKTRFICYNSKPSNHLHWNY
jgi:uncharacterized phage protein (TIGR02220 family)